MTADFWLLDAPDSMALQSEQNANGYGLAALTAEQEMLLIRNPVQASTDDSYRRVAKRLKACEMLVHLRYANTGDVSLSNTHPFIQDGRLFAHNGVIGDLDRIDELLGPNRAMVNGDTDSERLFALITLAIRDADGDVRAGIKNAVNYIAEEIELYSLNFVLADNGSIWAFRYPEHNPLMVLQRSPGDGNRAPLHHEDADGTMVVHSDDGTDTPIVVIASEKIGDEPGWDEVNSGELVHVGPDLKVDREMILKGSPKHEMALNHHAKKTQSFA